MTKPQLYARAVQKFGMTSQLHMCSEEMSELNKVLMKILRYGATDKLKKEATDEIADVLITVEQVALMLTDQKDLDERIEYKLQRLERML